MRPLSIATIMVCGLGSGAIPAAGASPAPVFACQLGAKSVSVTGSGRQFTYRFGAPGRPEITLMGTPHHRTDRYAGIEQQLRFTKAPYSYIVYSMEGNGQTGANAVSGLVVKNGSKTIADMACKRWTAFAAGANFDTLPQDSEAFSAM